MMRPLCAFMLGAAFVCSADADTRPADPFTRDLLMLSDWFEGEFDNEEQIWFEKDRRSATPEEKRHTRVHVSHKRVALPAFGDHVFYVEEYADNDPGNLVRQRFVTFASDPESGAIRMRQGFFRDSKAIAGAHNDASKLANITTDDVFFIDGCDVFWRRHADQFEGAMNDKSCVFGEGDKRRYSVHNLTLSADKYWRVDTTFLVSDDSLHVGHPVDEPYQMRRAKRFVCGVIFRHEDGSQQISDLSLHSQGGTVDVIRAHDGAEFTILLRDKEYPFYSDRPDFMYFSVRREGEERSVAYSVHDVRSRTLGVSIPGMVAHCYREGYQFRETYEQLQ